MKITIHKNIITGEIPGGMTYIPKGQYESHIDASGYLHLEKI